MMSMQLFSAIYAGIIGLLIGSFANVCVYRIPRGLSVVSPRSQCPNCNTPIVWYDNIPLLSWLLLKGSCRHCSNPISWRYPILEVTMGLAWASILWFYPLEAYSLIFIIKAITLFTLLWVLTLIDLETFLLPNVLTFPGIALGLLFAAIENHLTHAVIGAISGYTIFWLVAFAFKRVTGKDGMGQGDFKLLAMLGAFMGWQSLPFIILLSSVTGVVIGSASLLLAKKGLQAQIPYGPYLAAAGIIWFFWGMYILDWYQRVMGLV